MQNVRFRLIDGHLHDYDLSLDQTLTTLQAESTGWHIYAHKRLNARPLGGSRPAALDLLDLPHPLYGLNYYPAASPWRAFWAEFDHDIIAADMALIKDLGANSVRIFLPLESFLNDPETHHTHLQTFLTLADAAGLSVVPTLFDLKGDYAPHTWARDWAYLSDVLDILAHHRNVAFIDIKNEPDLDMAAHSPGLIEALVAHHDCPGPRSPP